MVGFTFSTFAFQGAYYTDVSGINDFGQILGNAVSGPDSSDVIFLEVDGKSIQIKVKPGSATVFQKGLNSFGVVIGNTVNAIVEGPLNGLHTVADPYPGEPVAGGINDLGDIVGSNETSPYGYPIYTAWVEKKGVFTTLAGAFPNMVPTGINDLGQIVGFFSEGEAGIHEGFLYTRGLSQEIYFPGADYTYPLAINNFGEVVGNYLAGGYHGFVMIDGKLSTVDVPGTGNVDTVISGVNDFGQIVGTYSDSKGQRGFIATPTAP